MKHVLRLLLVAVLLAVVSLHMPSAAHAQPYYYRWGPSAPDISCSTDLSGDIYATFSSQPVEWDLPAVSEFSYTYDYNGTTSSSGPYPTGVSGVGSTVYAALGSASLGTTYPVYYAVTLDTIIDGVNVYRSTLRGDCTADGPGTTSITNQVISPAGAGSPAAEAIPGPDMVAIPAGAVVGTFTANTPLYFDDNAGSASSYAMEIGKSLWVIGINASGTFYKVLLSGQTYWVPVDNIGPTYDDVWNGTPLPTSVVE